MITLSLSVGAIVYLLCGMGLIASLWVYYDYRDRRLFEDERRRVIFHCIRCDKLYAGRAGAEELNCPRCGLRNGRLRF